MPRPKLFFDEDVSAIVAARLRKAGWDLITAHSTHRCRETDDSQLEFAAAEGRVLVTRNHLDFLKIHTAWIEAGKSHHGIVISLWRPSADVMTAKLLEVLESIDIEKWPDLLVYA